MRPRLADLCCKAGGATRGYQRAGFYVVGVDIEPQPNYCGDEFLQADALTFDLSGFDAVHGSPPCQLFIRSGVVNKTGRIDLLTPLRQRLVEEWPDLPYVLENVPGAPMRADFVLCGSAFGLDVRRHRWFETNWPAAPWTPSCDHSRPITGVYGHPHGEGGAAPGMLPGDLETWRKAMGIDWMTAAEIGQAIPPAYTEFIGRQLMAQLEERAA